MTSTRNLTVLSNRGRKMETQQTQTPARTRLTVTISDSLRSQLQNFDGMSQSEVVEHALVDYLEMWDTRARNPTMDWLHVLLPKEMKAKILGFCKDNDVNLTDFFRAMLEPNDESHDFQIVKRAL